MRGNYYRQTAERLLSHADININGDRPWDIKVHNDNLFKRVLTKGSIGIGESYMDGWWDCEALDDFFHKIFLSRLDEKISPWVEHYHTIKEKLINKQRGSRAFKVGEQHYDVGNDLYNFMLGKRLVYSCGYWKQAQTLDEAQAAKLDLICRKLQLEPGMKVLDIGCGWGEAAKFAAEHYGAEVVGVTISAEQAKFAQELCKGLPVEIRLQDYGDLKESFDRIFSIGMFEHVGYKNYRIYMKKVRQCLKKEGLFLLHTIGGNRPVSKTDPWTEKYIFPNSMLPSPAQICTAAEGEFILEDWHCFGSDYDRTLMSWFENFNDNWHQLQEKYGNRFYRMWRFYLLSCAGAFRARGNQLWQILYSTEGIKGSHKIAR